MRAPAARGAATLGTGGGGRNAEGGGEVAERLVSALVLDRADECVDAVGQLAEVLAHAGGVGGDVAGEGVECAVGDVAHLGAGLNGGRGGCAVGAGLCGASGES